MTKKKFKNNYDSVTHYVAIEFEDEQKKEEFEARIDFSDKDARLYKIIDGELVDDTYIELSEDGMIIVLNDYEIEVDLLDFTLDGASFHFSCEDYDCLSIEIDAQCICDQQDEIAKNLAKTPPFGIDMDDPYAVLFEMLKYQQ